jgi:DNA-binding NarL/FixJ family response regulator
MRTVIAEDDFTCRCWLRGLVKRLGFTVAGEAANGDEAVRVVERLKPDIVLMDVSMPVCTGPQALPLLLAAHPEARVVMLTSIADEGTVRDCLEKGAVGYVRKDAPVDEIVQSLARLREEALCAQTGGPHAGS